MATPVAGAQGINPAKSARPLFFTPPPPAGPKYTPRDTLRLDLKISPEDVRVTDRRVTDCRFHAGEMLRERREVKLEREGRRAAAEMERAREARLGREREAERARQMRIKKKKQRGIY